MKKSILFFLMMVSLTFVANSQNISISTKGLDESKLGYSIKNINRYVDKKVEQKKCLDSLMDNSYIDFNSLKGIKIRLRIDNYINGITKEQVSKLIEIYTEDKRIKTSFGINIGDEKFNILKKLDGYNLRIIPNCNESKNKSQIILYDEKNLTDLVFYLRNNILFAFECRGQRFVFD